jgi:putative CocE/NonD family hydrolase
MRGGLISFVILALGMAPAAGQAPVEVRIPMRDGIELAGDLFLPQGPGPFPVVVTRTPYDREPNDAVRAPAFTAAGVALLSVSVRGRYDSGGEWDPRVHEGEDGQDLLAWTDAQEWCNGGIATMGGSYDGMVQLYTAALGAPELDAMAPLLTAPDPFENLPFDNGTFMAPFLLWAVTNRGRQQESPPNVTLSQLFQIFQSYPINRWDDELGRPTPWLDTWLEHWQLDEYWRDRSYEAGLVNVQVPTLLMSGWFDGNQPGSIRVFQALRDHPAEAVRQGLKFVVGPYLHGSGYLESLGELHFPGNAQRDGVGTRNRWLIDQLTGAGEHSGPRMDYYLMGRNVWLETDRWPPSETRPWTFYLSANGGLQAGMPESATESYLYDPSDPTPIVSPLPLADLTPTVGHMPNEVSGVVQRADTLLFATRPLTRPFAIAGPVTATVFLSSTAEDTDVGGQLVDLTPDGRTISLQHGLSRVRFRSSYAEPAPLAPGEIAEVYVDLWSTAYEFAAGHRIGLLVSSAQWPAFDAHRNLYDDLASGTDWQTATQTIHLGAEHPSRLLVHVLTPRYRRVQR